MARRCSVYAAQRSRHCKGLSWGVACRQLVIYLDRNEAWAPDSKYDCRPMVSLTAFSLQLLTTCWDCCDLHSFLQER